jgi:hypothetical protein
MTYLKETGVIVLMGTDPDQLVPELKRSKRYAADASGGVVMVKRH